MGFVYRKAVEADREQYLDFANMVFSCAHQPHDFQALIPKVYGADRKTAYMQNIALTEDGRIRGLVAVMPNEMNVMGEKLKTGFVGTVSTHPYGRGEGHMKKLMAMAIDGMRAEGVDLAMLGGQRQRYEYFGFSKVGVALDHNIGKANVRHALKDVCTDDVEIVEVKEGDCEAVKQAKALHDARKQYSERPEEEFLLITKTWFGKMSSIYVGGEYAGYMLHSGDMASVSEMVLRDYGNVRKVIKKVMDDGGLKNLHVCSAEFETELNRELMAFEEDVNPYAPVMIRVFDFTKVIGAFMKLKASYRAIEDGERGFVIDGQQVTIRVNGGCVEVSDEEFPGSVEMTAMEAQAVFFDINGWLKGYDLPMGWTGLPAFVGKVDEF